MLALPLFIAAQRQPQPVAPTPVWSGDFVLTIKGSGKKDFKGALATANLAWKVDRVAKGRIYVKKHFSGGALSRTPDWRGYEAV